jgi:hypothetical protein
MRGLLKKEPRERLGIAEIKKATFFSGKLDKNIKEKTPPFIPDPKAFYYDKECS